MTREQFIRNIKDTQGALRRFLTVVCCGDSALADDIAQEAYIKAYLSLDKFRDGESFAAWIRRIAYNEFVDQQRHARVSSPLDAAAQTTSDSASDTAFDYEQLYAAMAALSPRERSVVTLFYFDGFSSKEIADLTGISHDNVRKTLQRGREHLRFLIEKNMTENIKNALHQPEVDCALRNLFAGLKPAAGSSDAAFLRRLEMRMHAVDAIRSEMKRRIRIGHIALAAASAVSFTAGIAATLLMPDIIRSVAGILPSSLAVNPYTGDTAVTLSWAIAAALSISAAFGTFSLTRARLLCE